MVVWIIAISEWWTIGADLAVAAGTGLLAAFTWRVASRTTKLGDETHTLGVETAQEVRAGVRPVLIDPAGQSDPEIEVGGVNDFGSLQLVVRNAGRGPALNVSAYVLVATKAFDRRTPLATVGNVGPEELARVQLLDVPNTDSSGSMESYLVLRVVLVYSDLGGRRYHSIVRLTDPGKGQRRRGDTQWAVRLTQEGTEVGDGEAPPPQWRVSFYGKMTEGQEAQLRAHAIQYISAHAVGIAPSADEVPEPAAWTYSVMVSAETRDEALGRVEGALGEGVFGAWEADPWTSDPLDLPSESENQPSGS